MRAMSQTLSERRRDSDNGRPVLRRTLSLLAVILVAVIGVLGIPTAAYADDSLSVDGTSVCDPGTGLFVVNWTVTATSTSDGTFTSVSVTPSASTLSGFAVNSTITAGGSVTGSQSVPAGETGAGLSVAVHFQGSGQNVIVSGSVTLVGSCGRPKPSVTFTSNCDGTVDAALHNGVSATADAVFDVTASGSHHQITVPPGNTTTLNVPGAGDVVVSVGGSVLSTGRWKRPPTCPSATTPPATPPPTSGPSGPAGPSAVPGVGVGSRHGQSGAGSSATATDDPVSGEGATGGPEVEEMTAAGQGTPLKFPGMALWGLAVALMIFGVAVLALMVIRRRRPAVGTAVSPMDDDTVVFEIIRDPGPFYDR